MALIRPTNSGLIRPSGVGTGGAESIAWSTLSTTDMVDSLTDPNSIGNGAWSMSGSRIQIPVSSSAQYQSISSGLRGYWELPGGVMPGADGVADYCLAVSVEMANPSTAWAVHLGVVEEAATRGIASGVRYKTGGPGYSAQVIQWGNRDDSTNIGATLASHLGHVQLGGALGTASVCTLSTAIATDSANLGAPASLTGLGSWASGGTPRLAVVVTHHGLSLTSPTLDCLIRYARIRIPA